MARPKRFSLFHYFYLELTLSFVWGVRFTLLTPLAAIVLYGMSRMVEMDACGLGVRISVIPSSWRFRLEEGTRYYRYERFLGWRIGSQRWREIQWAIEKFFCPPRCALCKERITDFRTKPFARREDWKHARCATLEWFG